MGDKDAGQILHDRAARGLPLTDKEQAQLDAWYAALDQDEILPHVTGDEVEALRSLQEEVLSGLRGVLAAAQRVRELSDQNDALRRKLAALRLVSAAQ
jgi:hypothetical protein